MSTFPVLFFLLLMPMANPGELIEISSEPNPIQQAEPIPGEYLVQLRSSAKPGLQAVKAEVEVSVRAQELSATYGGSVEAVWDQLDGFFLRADAKTAERMAKDPAVRRVEQNRRATSVFQQPSGCYETVAGTDATTEGSPQTIVCDDPDPRNQSRNCPDNWGLDRIDQSGAERDGLYRYTVDGDGVHVYVLDTGIYADSREFGDRIGVGFNAIDSGRDVSDCTGHGTHVAGIIGGKTFGVAKGVTLHPVKWYERNDANNCPAAGGTYFEVCNAIDWILEQVRGEQHGGRAIVNWSGGNAPRFTDSEMLRDGFRDLLAAGIPVVQSAGNHRDDFGGLPVDACSRSLGGVPGLEQVLVVGGVDTFRDQGDERLGRWIREADDDSYSICAEAGDCGSNSGPCIDLWAPAAHIVSASIGAPTRACRLSGTSMAAPHATGVAALVLQENPEATVEEVADALRGGAVCDLLEVDATADYSIGIGSPDLLLSSLLDGSDPDSCDDAPIAAFSVSCEGLLCTFDASSSSDDHGIVDYRWEFDGGEEASATGAISSNFYYRYQPHGVTLTVTDTSGQESRIRREAAPVARPIAPDIGGWWNPERSGNGFDLQRTADGQYLLVWATYEEDGRPTWFVSDPGPVSNATWNEPIFRTIWDGSQVVDREAIGDVRLTFSDPRAAVAEFHCPHPTCPGWPQHAIDNTATERFAHFLGGEGTTGLWYPPCESGWGLSLWESGNTLVSTVWIYDENGQPRWVQGVGNPGPEVSMPVRSFTGIGLCPLCSGGSSTPPPSRPAGTVILERSTTGAPICSNGPCSSSTSFSTAITIPAWNRTSACFQLVTAPAG